VADFCTEVVGTSQVTLVGNSIGCIACLSAAALLGDTKGLVLLNSAGNLDIEEEVSH
jgi:pimeloyl-ACP methyl ester carboxylesterase